MYMPENCEPPAIGRKKGLTEKFPFSRPTLALFSTHDVYRYIVVTGLIAREDAAWQGVTILLQEIWPHYNVWNRERTIGTIGAPLSESNNQGAAAAAPAISANPQYRLVTRKGRYLGGKHGYGVWRQS
jgi:hypothetical protein